MSPLTLALAISGCANNAGADVSAPPLEQTEMTTSGPWQPTIGVSPHDGLSVMPMPANVVSPTSFPGLESEPDLSWVAYGQQLWVTWGNPSPPATSGSAPAQGQWATAGFAITDSAQVPVTHGQGQVTALHGTHQDETLTALPDHQIPDTSTGVESDRWVTWRVPDGRYAHLWKADATSEELIDMAATVVDQPISFHPVMAVGLAPGGFSPVAMSKADNPNSLQFASVTLCPPGTELADPFEGDPGTACILTAIFSSSDIARVGQGAPEQRMNAGGRDVHIVPSQHLAYAVVSDKLAVVAIGPSNADIEPAQISALIASVQVDPALATRG